MRPMTTMLTLALLTLSGCGTCVGASCPDYDDAAPATLRASVMAHDYALNDTGDTDVYIDEDAVFEYTGSEAVLTYTDEDGNVWEVRYDTHPISREE